MSQDISRVLNGWDFDPHELNVRMIQGDDGEEKIQMRIDLGLLQMCLSGRPDGQQPYGYNSVLEYYLNEAKEYGEGYSLASEALEELFREGLQFYHRYLCLFHLGNYELVVRDTDRNLGMFEFVLGHARKRRDQWRFDQYRPYVLMMNTRAKAMIALESQRPGHAVEEIDRGCERISGFLEQYGRAEDECFELDFLQRWGEELRQAGITPTDDVDSEGDLAETSSHERVKRPRDSDLTTLQIQLAQAIEREEYERAAVIRDRIKQFEQNQQQ